MGLSVPWWMRVTYDWEMGIFRTPNTYYRVTAAVIVDSFPVHIDDLVENIRLDVVIDINAQLGGNAVDDAGKGQAEYRAAQHDGDHQPQAAAVIPGDDIDGHLAGHAGHQAEAGTHDAKDRIKQDRQLIALAVGEDPAPVVQDLPQAAILAALAQDPHRIEDILFSFQRLVHNVPFRR